MSTFSVTGQGSYDQQMHHPYVKLYEVKSLLEVFK